MILVFGLLAVIFQAMEVEIGLGGAVLRPVDVWIVLCAVAYLANAAGRSSTKPLTIPRGPVIPVLLCYLAIGLFSGVAFSPYPGIGRSPPLGGVVRQGIELVEYIILVVLLYNVVTPRQALDALSRFALFTPLLVVFNFVVLLVVNPGGLFSMLESDQIGLLAGFGFLLNIFRMHRRGGIDGRGAAATLFLLIAVGISLKRVVWASTAAGLLFWMLFPASRAFGGGLKPQLVSLLTAGGATLLLLVVLWMPTERYLTISSNLATLTSPLRTLLQEDPQSNRNAIWRYATELGSERPLTGTGWGGWKSISSSLPLPPKTRGMHNYFLLNYVELGFLGLLTFVVLVVLPLQVLWVRPRSPEQAWLAMITVVTWAFLFPALLVSNVSALLSFLLVSCLGFSTLVSCGDRPFGSAQTLIPNHPKPGHGERRL